jgi:hypothetical protein
MSKLREDVIRIAREAWLTGLEESGLLENFERFAVLVAAAERERCAKICEQLQDWPEGATPYDCAAAIKSAE